MIEGAVEPELPQEASLRVRSEREGRRDRREAASDLIVHHLRVCLHKAQTRPSEMSSACVDHVVSALHAYLAQSGNVIPLTPSMARGGLAPWQLRRAEEILLSRLDGTVTLAELAEACNLSPGYFTRAFRQTTGRPPHRWLMKKRVEKAEDLLVATKLSLAEIAVACGFADQSHFTRVFSRVIGWTPGAWRRNRRTGGRQTEQTEQYGYRVA